ncbi:MAG TPA: STAS domain-containing protein [Herpetosiphonaceae bacterium]|nr:STAS domain-containing protein [Herpetosiphonaceae bacterium]
MRRRVTWIVTLAAILPLLSVWGLALQISYRSQQGAAQSDQIALGNLIADDFGRYIRSSEDQLQVFADAIGGVDDTTAITDDWLATLVLSSSDFHEVGLYDGAGDRQAIAARTAATMPPSIAGTPLFERVKTGLAAYVDPPPVAAGTSLPLAPDEVPRLRIAVAAASGAGARRYLVGDIRMDQLWAITSRIETATNTHLLVLTADGTLVSAGRTQLLLAPPAPQSLPLLQGAAVQTYAGVNGADVLGIRARIEPLGWVLMVERPLDEIYAAVNRLGVSLLLVILVAVAVVILVGWLAGRRIANPIQELHRSVESFTRDPAGFQPVVISTGDELTRLGDAFNSMASGLNESQATLARANEALEATVATRTAELERALHEVQLQYGEQERLLETVRTLGMPVIPITRGIVVMPLVGQFNSARAGDIASHVLSAIERERARVILIDVTGVPTVDTAMAAALLDTIRAAQLLGTQVILAGIRPDMAETLINLGIGTSGIRTAATLEHAFLMGGELLEAAHRRIR